jgi:hypothetical protein
MFQLRHQFCNAKKMLTLMGDRGKGKKLIVGEKKTQIPICVTEWFYNLHTSTLNQAHLKGKYTHAYSTCSLLHFVAVRL